MASRDMLLREIHVMLQKNGFATSDPKNLVHAGFDIVARKGQLILVIKVAANASSLTKHAVAGMLTLARAVNGSPIIIGIKNGAAPVENGVMYTRAGIPLISSQSFHDLVEEGVPPLIFAASGGYYVNIDSEIIKNIRKSGVSLGELAEMGGVSRRTIRMYEDGMNANLEVAIRLEEKMGIELIIPADPLASKSDKQNSHEEYAEWHGANDFSSEDELARDIFLKLHEIGYSIERAKRCPFDAVTQDRDTILFTGIGHNHAELAIRARAISNLSEILEKHSVIFLDRRGSRVNLGGNPVIGCKELDSVHDKKKIMELIEERV